MLAPNQNVQHNVVSCGLKHHCLCTPIVHHYAIIKSQKAIHERGDAPCQNQQYYRINSNHLKPPIKLRRLSNHPLDHQTYHSPLDNNLPMCTVGLVVKEGTNSAIQSATIFIITRFYCNFNT